MIVGMRARQLDVMPSVEASVRCGCGCWMMVHECPFEYRQRHASWLYYLRFTGQTDLYQEVTRWQ